MNDWKSHTKRKLVLRLFRSTPPMSQEELISRNASPLGCIGCDYGILKGETFYETEGYAHCEVCFKAVTKSRSGPHFGEKKIMP